MSILESATPKPGSLALNFDIGGDGRLPLEIQIWIEDLTGHVHPAAQVKFNVPSTLFLSRLEDFKTLRSKFGNFPLDYDEYFKGLIDNYSAMINRLTVARESIDLRISSENVREGLHESGFLRWDTQTDDQLRDVGRLAFLPNGANFSVPGSGKTNALLAVHCLLKLDQPDLKLIVACPKNAMIAWDEEVSACIGAGERVVRLEGSRAKLSRILENNPPFVVVSYQLLKSALPQLLSFMRMNKVHLVLDESHRIKAGHKSQQGSAALTLADYAVRRDILSGTPMPQGFSDLVSQFKFLWPSLDLFRNISQDLTPEEQIMRANVDIKPLFVRTTKSELGLPKPKIRDHNVRMSESQAATYMLIKDESARYIARLNSKDKEELRSIGKQIMRVMQFCSDPALLLSRLSSANMQGELGHRLKQLASEPSAKLLKLDKLVQRTMRKSGGKVVIWSMFVDQIENLARRYLNFGAITIHGGVPTGPDDDLAFREARIKKFKTDPDCRILVANPAACGEGISLHKTAHHAIYFDRSFNAAHFLQSIDRIHRRGLDHDVVTEIDILCLSGTIEEAVRSRLSKKIAFLEQLLDDKDLSAMVFDPEDVHEAGDDDFVSESDLDAVFESLMK